MTRIIHLDEHVSRVQSSVLELLDSTGCNLLLLSDVQIAVLAQMVFPYVWWPTRLVEDHEQYQIAVDFPTLYRDELECLELLLSGGATMTCDLSAVLTALADAIRTGGGGNGGCAPAGPAAILNCVGQMTPEELIPQPAENAPQGGVPPEGFETWAVYLTYKCQAAHAIYDTVYGLFGALALLPIAAVTIQLIGTALAGYFGATAFGATVYPPAAIVGIVALALAIGLINAQAYIQFIHIQDYLRDHQDEIVCALYTSGSAAQALEALAAAVEDAIQSVQWAALFGGVVGPELAAAVGAMAAEAQTNNLVNPLFRATEDFAYPEADCSSCGAGCEEQAIADFAVDLDGATLYNETGGLGFLEWDDTTTPPGSSAHTGQAVDHAVVYSGWQMPVSFVIPTGAYLEWTQYLTTNVSCVAKFQIAGEWVVVDSGDYGGEHNFQISLAPYAGDWVTGLRWTGAKEQTIAWGCHIAEVTVKCY